MERSSLVKVTDRPPRGLELWGPGCEGSGKRGDLSMSERK